MTLGNLHVDSRGGLIFLDWETGRTRQLTGTGPINWDPEIASRFPGARRTVELAIDTS